MQGFLAAGETYERELKLPGSDDVLKVTLRPLTAGDRADLQDQLRILVANDDEEDADDAATSNVLQLRPGTNRILTVAAALVSWNLDVAPTVTSVRQLKPNVLDWLFAETSWGEAPPEQTEEELAGHPLPGTSDSSNNDELETDGELS